MHMELGTCWPVIRYVFVYYCNITIETVQYRYLILWGLNFHGCLSMVIYEALYAWCLRYNICSTWFVDIRIPTFCTEFGKAIPAESSRQCVTCLTLCSAIS